MAKYKVSITVVGDDALGKAVALLSSTGYSVGVAEIKFKQTVLVNPILAPASPPATSPLTQTRRPTIAPKREVNGIQTQDTHRGRIALSVFKTWPIARGKDFEDAFIKAGYAGTTWGAVVSDLVVEGQITRMKRGVYKRATNGAGV